MIDISRTTLFSRGQSLRTLQILRTFVPRGIICMYNYNRDSSLQLIHMAVDQSPHSVSCRAILDFLKEITGTSGQLCLLGHYSIQRVDSFTLFAVGLQHPIIVITGLADERQWCSASIFGKDSC